MGLDDRLADLARARRQGGPDGVDVDAALARVQASHFRRVRRRRLTAVGVVMACLALFATIVVVAGADDGQPDQDVVAGPDGNAPPPEPATHDGLRMWVSASSIPEGTEELAVALVNAVDTASPTFGVRAAVERWDGSRWAPHRLARLCVDFWLCRGDLVAPGEQLAVEDIGIGVNARSVGSLLWLPVSDLREGAYRLAMRGGRGDGEDVKVTGRFDIVAGDVAERPPRARPLDAPQLVAGPPVVPRAGGEVRLEVAGLDSAQAIEEFWAALVDPEPSDYPALDRWTADGWSRVASFGGVLPVDGSPNARRIVLPSLTGGAYRLVAGGAEARLWVEDLFGATTATADFAAGAVEELGSGPLAPRNRAAMAVAGDALLVWGGSIEGPNVGRPDLGFETYADGAVYDLGTGRWEMLPPAPLPASSAPQAVAVPTGIAVFSDRQGAVWSPTRREWRALPDTPVSTVDAVAVDDGVLVLGPAGEGGAFLSGEGAEWNSVLPPPVAGDRAVVSTGGEVIVVDASGGARWRPGDDGWRSLPPFDLGRDERAVDAAWTGESVVVAGYEMNVTAFDPSTNRWRRLSSLPVRFYEGMPSVFAVNRTVAVSREPALAVLTASGWTTLPHPPSALLEDGVVVGDALYSFGFTADAGNRLVRVRPTVAVANPPMIQIGSARLPLERDDDLERTAAITVGSRVTGLALTISTAAGVCEVTATFNVGRSDTAPLEQPDGRWEAVVAGDRIIVDCHSAAQAERIAASLRPFGATR